MNYFRYAVLRGLIARKMMVFIAFSDKCLRTLLTQVVSLAAKLCTI